jgi:DNA-binding SARP family transcriptional activator/predicted ATPase
MADLSIHLLGPFQVTQDGQPVTSFEYDKVRALLAYLVVEKQRPHRREALAGLLWPDKSEKAAHDSLRNALSRLRHALGDSQSNPPFLITNREEIQLNPASNTWLDVAVFSSLLDECNHHAHPGIGACPECLEHLSQAAALYQGSFLAGFFLSNALAFEEWCTVKREQLQRQSFQALQQLVDAHTRRNELSQALPYAYRLVELEPLDEEANRQLMRLLAMHGQRNEALAQYEALQQLLESELGVQPDQDSQALYSQILFETRGEPRTGNLPAPLTPLIGRQAELAEIHNHLENPDCRMLTILGPGGVGKTRLALEIAQAQRYNFPHGTYLVPLSALHGPEALYPAIIEALSIPLGKSKDPRQMVLDYLRQKRVLLVLDSFEVVLEGNELAAELLGEAPGLKILVTSRVKLNIEGEEVYPLKGMQFPASDQLEEAEQFSAVQLFSAGAHRCQPDFALNHENAAGVVWVCQLVQGMPLGLLLACAWVGEFQPVEIAQEIEKNLDFLATEGGSLPGRQRSMRATFDYSWNLLKDKEREAMCRLSVFRCGFTHAMAEEVAQVTAYELRSLVEKSLLTHSQEVHYGMHDLLRQYAGEKLAGSLEEENAVRQRHSHYFLKALKKWETEQEGAGQIAALTEMDKELPDIQNAWGWACQHQDLPGLALGWNGLCRYYMYRNRNEDGEHDCQAALDMLENMAELSPQVLRLKANLVAYQSIFQANTGQIDGPSRRQMLEQCLQILERLQQAGEDVRLYMVWIIGELSEYIPDKEQAIQVTQHSLDLARQIGNKRSLALSMGNLAIIYHNFGEFEKAERYYQDALVAWRNLGDMRHIAMTLQSFSLILITQGKIQPGLQAARESAQLYRSQGDRASYAYGLSHLGLMCWFGRQWEEADKAYEENIPNLQIIGNRTLLCDDCARWSIIKMFLSQYEAAQAMAQRSMEMAVQLHDVFAQGCCNYVLGGATLAQGQAEQASAFLENAAAFLKQVGFSSDWAWAIGTWSLALNKMGQLKKAQEVLVEALQTGVELHSYPSLSYALPSAAYMLAIDGKVERAVELCGLIDEQAMCGKTPWFEDVVGKSIKEISASLPPKVVEAARERGRNRDLFDTAAELLEEFKNQKLGLFI